MQLFTAYNADNSVAGWLAAGTIYNADGSVRGFRRTKFLFNADDTLLATVGTTIYRADGTVAGQTGCRDTIVTLALTLFDVLGL